MKQLPISLVSEVWRGIILAANPYFSVLMVEATFCATGAGSGA
jgi:hypothetical protein